LFRYFHFGIRGFYASPLSTYLHDSKTRLPSSHIIALIFRRSDVLGGAEDIPGLATPSKESSTNQERQERTARRPETYVHRAMARKSKRILQRGFTHTPKMQQVHHALLHARTRPTSAFTCVSPRERNFPSLSLSASHSLLVHFAHLRAFSSLTIPRTSCRIDVSRAVAFFRVPKQPSGTFLRS